MGKRRARRVAMEQADLVQESSATMWGSMHQKQLSIFILSVHSQRKRIFAILQWLEKGWDKWIWTRLDRPTRERGCRNLVLAALAVVVYHIRLVNGPESVHRIGTNRYWIELDVLTGMLIGIGMNRIGITEMNNRFRSASLYTEMESERTRMKRDGDKTERHFLGLRKYEFFIFLSLN